MRQLESQPSRQTGRRIVRRTAAQPVRPQPAAPRTLRRKRHRRRRRRILARILGMVCLVCLGAGLFQVQKWFRTGQLVPVMSGHGSPSHGAVLSAESDFSSRLEAFAREHDLPLNQWPAELLETAATNPELEDFVLQYPLKKDLRPAIDLTEYRDTNTVPLLMQWDERWGYTSYAGNWMGLSGCGPTCLSMVTIYLKNDPQYDPLYMAEFSQKNGYSVPGGGSAWALISEGGRKLGLDVVELPLDKNRVIRNLEVGNPVICVMGPGDFTTTGHFIVMTGYEDGKIRVNDPNSRERSAQLWDFDAIQGQIKNLWACR